MDTFPVIYHANYGSFRLEEEHLQEYNRRTGSTLTRHHARLRGEDLRFDPVMAAVVQDLAAVESDLRVEWHPVKYRDYVNIDEYDGFETVNININLYLLDQIAEVLVAPDIDDTERCWRINELVQQREHDVNVHSCV